MAGTYFGPVYFGPSYFGTFFDALSTSGGGSSSGTTAFVATIRAKDLQRETAEPLALVNPGGLTNLGSIRGVSLPRYQRNNLVKSGYTALFRIPLNMTVTTGLTFTIYLSNDRTSIADLGTKVYIGITVKAMLADAAFDIDADDTEELVSITLSATTGGVAIGTLTIANANLDSAVAGSLVLMRIRRKGTDVTNDTCPGRVLLYQVEVANT